MTGGDIIELTFNHPTLGTGTIFPKAGEDGELDLGGFRSDDDDSMIAGNGAMIDRMTRKRWSFSTTVAWDMNEQKDLEKLSALAESPVLAEWTLSHINGTVYGGTGKPVGDLKGNTDKATFPLKLQGGSKLKKII